MWAARVAAERIGPDGGRVTLLEKNAKTGAKILMSGGTRCNLTQDCDARGATEAFMNGGRWLQKPVGRLPPDRIVRWFNEHGVATKVESTGKIFPESDRALEVRDALLRSAVAAGVQVRTRAMVVGVERQDGGWVVRLPDGDLEADRIIVTAGGRSWPGCGTTGDAYGWLETLGHTIVPTRPALVPLTGGDDLSRSLAGLTIDDTVATVRRRGVDGKRGVIDTRRGGTLWTHTGYSGPAPMNVSGAITGADSIADVSLEFDLLPDVSEKTLEHELTGGGRSAVSNVLSRRLPNSIADAVVTAAGGDTAAAELSRRRRTAVVEGVKRHRAIVHGTRGFAKAEVTAGGVTTDEICPRTMHSRIADGLFIAGEVLDVDGPIGGYNFTAAFATGQAAGEAVGS